LYKRLQQTSEPEPPQPPQPPQPPVGGQPCDDGEPTEGGDQPSDEQGDGEGNPVNGNGDKPSDQEGDEQGDKPSDKPADKPNKGRGKADFEGGRDVEPSDFIQREMKDESFTVDDGKPRPSVGKPKLASFEWS
jgi:hypothetical protein